MSEYLFVYGTLLGRTPDPAVNRVLRRYCGDAGAASVWGRLYRLGWYPGLAVDTGAPQRVQGRLLRLDAPSLCWSVLDAYEGYLPGAPARSEFVRKRIVVRRKSDGSVLVAWTYVYNGDPGRGRPIRDWRRRVRQGRGHAAPKATSDG
jgi:gamma-glutamylcyclotransferase (GGCT)/AIG2-like uncharacterized protein YtfP